MVNVKGSPPPRTTPAGLILAIAQLSTKERDLLVSAVREGDECFAVPQERQIQLAVATAWSAGEISFALQVLERLYSRINDPEEDWPSSMATRARLSAEFEKALGNVLSDVTPAVESVLPLVTPNPRIELARKRARLREGILPNAVGFLTYVDLRPNFDRKGSEIQGISEFVKQIQLTIFTDIPLTDNRDFIVLQLDQPGLDALKAAVELLEAKLRALDAYNANAPIR